MYLDHTFARKTFAQRIGSAKVKSKSEVTHCSLFHPLLVTTWLAILLGWQHRLLLICCECYTKPSPVSSWTEGERRGEGSGGKGREGPQLSKSSW